MKTYHNIEHRYLNITRNVYLHSICKPNVYTYIYMCVKEHFFLIYSSAFAFWCICYIRVLFS